MKEHDEEMKEVEGVRTRNSERKTRENRRSSKRETSKKTDKDQSEVITDICEEKNKKKQKKYMEVSGKDEVDNTEEEMRKQSKGRESEMENGEIQKSSRSRRKSNREQAKLTQLKKKETEEDSEENKDMNKSKRKKDEEDKDEVAKSKEVLSPPIENDIHDKTSVGEMDEKWTKDNEEHIQKKNDVLEKWKNRNKNVRPDNEEGANKKEKGVDEIEQKEEKKETNAQKKEREKEKEEKESNDMEDPDHKNHKRSTSIEKQKNRSKEKERDRDRDRIKHRDRSRERSREKKKRKYDSSDSSDGIHSYRRKRKDSHRGGKDRSDEESVERSRTRRKYEDYSSSEKDDRSYHKFSKKKRKKRKGNHSSSSERNFSSSSSSRSYKNKDHKDNRSSSSSKSVEKKKKTKWDTVDESLLKNSLIDANLQNMLQKQNLALASTLLQNNKVLQLNRNSYEMETDKKQRKLYIGNIPANCKQEDIIDFFNKVLLTLIKDTSLDIKLGDVQLMPVLKCDIFNIDSRFCFLEFRTAEITSLSLRMDGVSFNNYTLRLGRPHDYIPPPGGDPAFTSEFADIDFKIIETLKQNRNTQSKSSDDEHKLYIQNLPHDLKDDQIKDILEQFGKLKAFNIIKDPNTGLNKGYGFFEYEDTNCTQVAIHALNGFVCGHNILNVKKAASNKNQNTQNNVSGNSEGYVSLLRGSISQKILSNSIIGLQVQASRKVGEKPSRVVQLTNIIFQEDLLIDSQYDEILKEIKEEAEKYGPLQSVVIPKPNLDLTYTEGVGKVFLYYFDETTARKAQYMLNGRLFEKRVICAAFYSEELFLKGKYVLP